MSDLFSADEAIFQIQTRAPGPAGSLPLTDELLRQSPSGDLFGLTQNVGMGWEPSAVAGKQFLILSTQGGLRAPDGKPIALGYHTGHWEIGLLVQSSGARSCASSGRSPSPPTAPILAMGARKAPRACSTASRIAMTRRWFSGGSFARCRAGAG